MALAILAKAHTSATKIDCNNNLNALVKEKLNINFATYEYLYSFELEERYILVSGDNCYLVYDTYLNDYVEFSNSSMSIYSSLKNDTMKVYLLPTYYFYYKNNKFYDIYYDKELSEEDILLYKQREQTLINEYNLYSRSYNNGLDVTSTAPTSFYIPYSYYFVNLSSNIGSNSETSFKGSCSYVRLEMVLQYYDNTLNDNIISENYDVKEIKNFSSYAAISSSTFVSSPGIDDNFHSYLINLGRSYNYTNSNENSMSLANMGNLLNAYFGNSSTATAYMASSSNKETFCRNAITDGKPVVIHINGIDSSIDSRELNHAVVGYGYDSTGIIAHFGWKSGTTYSFTAINIHNYTIYAAVYFDFNMNHLCSNNYEWNSTICHGYTCPCGYNYCSHNYIYNNSNEVAGHTMQCNFCGDITLQPHNFIPSGRGYRCSICSYYTIRPVIINSYSGSYE